MRPPIATWNRAQSVWETRQITVCGHLAVFSETWPSSGMTQSGSFYPLPQLAPHTSVNVYSSAPGLLPTPAAYDGERGGPQDPAKRRQGGHQPSLADQILRGLPTLPTPKVTDAHHSSPADMNRNEPGLRAIGRLLATPRATDETHGGPNQRGSAGDLTLPSTVARLLPSPMASSNSKSTRTMTSSAATGGQRHAEGGQSGPLGLAEVAALATGQRPEHLPADGQLGSGARRTLESLLLPTPESDGESSSPPSTDGKLF